MNSAFVAMGNQSGFPETQVCLNFVANDRDQSEDLRIARWGLEFGETTAYGSSVTRRKLWTDASQDDVQLRRLENIWRASFCAFAGVSALSFDAAN
jgi:hypothetical protein